MNIVYTLAVAWMLTLAAACSRTPGHDDASAGSARAALPPDALAEIQTRAGRRFTAATLARPDGAVDLPFDVYLAPLIVQEAAPQGSPADPGFGRIALSEDGLVSVLTDQPTVYYLRSKVSIEGREHDQLAFLWWYPRQADGSGGPQAQGVRVTFGQDGLPALWEVLEDRSGARLVFASEVLEERALAQHGAPAEGRRFGLERSLDEAPLTVVARAITPGPVPMGPYVHLERATRSVRTIACRCMPSEFDALVGESLYALADLASLGALGLEKRSWTPALPAPAGEGAVPEEGAGRDWLGHHLRLPERW